MHVQFFFFKFNMWQNPSIDHITNSNSFAALPHLKKTGEIRQHFLVSNINAITDDKSNLAEFEMQPSDKYIDVEVFHQN